METSGQRHSTVIKVLNEWAQQRLGEGRYTKDSKEIRRDSL
jgi:hypothetical protein